MRKVVRLSNPTDEARRLMICESGDGTFLFLYKTDEDGPCYADFWFESSEEAESFCVTEYGVQATEWEQIPNAKPGCQHDWIAPTRAKRDQQGKKLWGSFEPAE